MTPTLPKITVVMAAHNAAATIGRAIDSVLAQDVDGLTLMIVDDGSTDSTAEAVQRHTRSRDDTITLRLPQRRGYANALAAGFRASASDYIICCDADDTMAPGALRSLRDEALLTDADVVFAPLTVHRGSSTKVIRLRRPIRSLNDMPVDTVHFSLCNKLMRTSIFHSHDITPYPDLDRWADLGMTARFMTYARRISSIDTPVYDYYLQPSSLSHSGKDRLLHDHLAVADMLTRWFAEHELTATYAEFLNHLKFCAKVKYARNPGRNLRQWARTYPEVTPSIMQLRHIPLGYRILFRTAALLIR